VLDNADCFTGCVTSEKFIARTLTHLTSHSYE
jgi:hypothetical protein